MIFLLAIEKLMDVLKWREAAASQAMGEQERATRWGAGALLAIDAAVGRLGHVHCGLTPSYKSFGCLRRVLAPIRLSAQRPPADPTSLALHIV